MPLEKIEFDNPQGHSLSGRLHLPEHGPPVACAVFAHCFTCTKNIRAATILAGALAERGIATLRFDFTGLGESEGDFVETTFTGNVDDLVAAAEVMGERLQAPALLVGHSLGGAAVVRAAARIPSVRAVVTINAPARPDHLLQHFDDALERIEREGRAEVSLGGHTVPIGKQFVEDIREAAMTQAAEEMDAALLVMHAPTDGTVGIANARQLFDAAKHPKSFIALDGADHLLSDEADAVFAADMVAAWARRHVSAPEHRQRAELELGDRVTARIGRDHYRTELVASGHRMLADEPSEMGGTGQGPSPYDLLLAGLGACTAMTMRMYADRKEWPLESVTVRLRHERVHAKDCARCESARGRIDHIEREIRVTGDLDETQRERLLEIAGKCPVHRTLESETVVDTHWAEGEGGA